MTMTQRARLARLELRQRQNEARGFDGLHGAKRVARGDWLGGYAHYVVTDDGGILCPTCVREEWDSIVYAHRHGLNDGWRPTAITHDGNFDMEPEYCAHCGDQLHEGFTD